MSAEAPALLVVFALEAEPRLRLVCNNDGEELRLRDWLRQHPVEAELAFETFRLMFLEEQAA